MRCHCGGRFGQRAGRADTHWLSRRLRVPGKEVVRLSILVWNQSRYFAWRRAAHAGGASGQPPSSDLAVRPATYAPDRFPQIFKEYPNL